MYRIIQFILQKTLAAPKHCGLLAELCLGKTLRKMYLYFRIKCIEAYLNGQPKVRRCIYSALRGVYVAIFSVLQPEADEAAISFPPKGRFII